MPGAVFIIGTAGSGKTVLSAVLRRYLQSQTPDLDVINVNLDPAVQSLPYTCEVDVREYIDIQELINNYELGPNGAMIHATDLIASQIHVIMEEINDYEADSILIDTPGQLEVFVYRTAGPLITSMFDTDTTASLFLFDGNIVKRASSWISLSLLAASTYFRLGLPTVYGLSKIDLLETNDLERMKRWSEDIDLVLSDMDSQDNTNIQQLSMSLALALQEMQSNLPLIPFTALKEEGIEDIAAFLSRIWQHGDDWII
ncbi:MAG: ATP/GTP-binding protein [Candidatus Hodarchaeales archaeon]